MVGVIVALAVRICIDGGGKSQSGRHRAMRLVAAYIPRVAASAAPKSLAPVSASTAAL